MQVLAHIDPWVLERELLARVDAAHPTGDVVRTLVLVPSIRLAEQVQRRLARARPAWLGLEVLPFPGLARRILAETPGPAPYAASPLLRDALLRRLLRERPANLWSRYVERRPGTARPLLEALKDLREAGVEPADLSACAAGDPRALALAEIFAPYHEALGGPTWTDEAGLARAARVQAARFGESLGAVFVHGAYEILGVYLDLLRQLDRTTGVTVLVPVAPGARVTLYAERFMSALLDGRPESPVTAGDSAQAERLTALYDEQASPPAAPAGSFGFRHAQGTAAEVKYAVREALRAVRDGCPPAEIAITARSLEPYAAALEETLADAELPWTSSLTSPLRRHPLVREFLLLLRVVAEDFPRGATVELLQARHLRWKALGCKPPAAARADAWSREARIIGGLDEWTNDLEAWAAAPRARRGRSSEERARDEQLADARVERSRSIGDALRRVDAELPRADGTWSEHAGRLRGMLEALFRSDDSAVLAELEEILATMADLERLAGDTRTIGFGAARAWLEEAVDATRVALRRDDDGGLRVLDAMQMRGLTFRRVHLLGLNGDLFPRAPREDPVLADAVRRALRDRTARPLRVESEATDEEHLLLALWLGSAAERVDVSWQRADESGRAKVPSLALREIARAALGRPDVDGLRASALHLPSHPAQWLEALVDGTGLLAPGEEMLLAALHSRAADAAARLEARFPALASGLETLRATQSFVPARAEYDARIGPADPGDPTFSVSDLEVLGRCPLQFFFAKVLRVQPLEESASALELPSQEIGTLIHALLEEVYAGLRAEGRFGGDPQLLVRRGLELVDERRAEIWGPIGARLTRRLPGLWNRFSTTWFESVRRFVEHDLCRIGEDGLVPASLEDLVSHELDFGEGVSATVRGKFDRLLASDTVEIVGDYKTTSKLAWRVQPTSMLKAGALQVPLYHMLAGPQASVELLGIHPDLDPAEGQERHSFRGFAGQVGPSFQHTMRVLLRLHAGGSYPFRAARHCDWCRYDKACRRNHPPTQERELLLEDAQAFREVQEKSVRRPYGP